MQQQPTAANRYRLLAEATQFSGAFQFVVMIVKALGILLLHSIRYLFDMVCPRSTKWETFVGPTYMGIRPVFEREAMGGGGVRCVCGISVTYIGIYTSVLLMVSFGVCICAHSILVRGKYTKGNGRIGIVGMLEPNLAKTRRGREEKRRAGTRTSSD